MSPVLLILLTLQFLLIVSHDFLDILHVHHGSQVRRTVGYKKFLLATAINALFPATAALTALYYTFTHHPQPRGITLYQALYCLLTLASAVGMWWLPYFRGTDEKTRRLYTDMYAGTAHLLPPRGPAGTNPRPNVLHLAFHALFLTTAVLTCLALVRP